ncbi:MAG: prepilin-type N-terminal cleavage/methylation domain-containing protein [Phycisphaerales bacterium]|nr:MAG: prepilin-type N-terminal cleavage/methylation domain-containing protein [Phycisphaerales bacterium]
MRKRTRPSLFVGRRGFTLAELLVALTISGIILSSAVTLSFALGRANEVTDDGSRKQAQVRYATMRLSELIRHCRLVCSVSGDDVGVWRADYNGDGKININELVYIERGPGADHLRLCEFTSGDGATIDLGSIEAFATNWWSAYGGSVNYVDLIPECSSVQFSFDVPVPETRLVSISFKLVENGVVRTYETTARLRGWAGNLLNPAKSSIVSDDD